MLVYIQHASTVHVMYLLQFYCEFQDCVRRRSLTSVNQIKNINLNTIFNIDSTYLPFLVYYTIIIEVLALNLMRRPYIEGCWYMYRILFTIRWQKQLQGIYSCSCVTFPIPKSALHEWLFVLQSHCVWVIIIHFEYIQWMIVDTTKKYGKNKIYNVLLYYCMNRFQCGIYCYSIQYTRQYMRYFWQVVILTSGDPHGIITCIDHVETKNSVVHIWIVFPKPFSVYCLLVVMYLHDPNFKLVCWTVFPSISQATTPTHFNVNPLMRSHLLK